MRLIKVLFSSALLISAASANAQNLKDYANQANDFFGGKKTGTKSSGSINDLSSTDITNGLREALNVGAKNAVSRVSAVNGFFGNPLIKIPMPPEAKTVETTLREIGLGQQVDDAVLSMNRAAEDASSKVVNIFIDAIKNMTIQDGVNILKGGNDAATQYLKSKTTVAITNAFRPIIQGSLDKVNATKYWAEVFGAYNKLPMTFNKVNPDLVAYVTERALNGLFVNIAQEETKIRSNPQARVTGLLQKVFGAH